MSADHNLLFGILALQNGFVSRDQLLEAMNVWVHARQRPLGDLLQEHGLGLEDHDLLESLVNRQLARHQGVAEISLRALPVSTSIRVALTAVPDAEVQAALAWLGTPPSGEGAEDHVSGPGGERLRYPVLRAHAKGGLGEVFVAWDTELHREVALKEIQARHADDPDCRDRFLLEAEITGRLEHPGIVPVYGLGSYADGRPFYAMRFIKGDSFGHAIARFHAAKTGFDTVAFRQILRRFLDTCNAVAYAHSRGVLHRDLKPGNVLLGEFGETVLVDWGLAKIVGGGEAKEGEATLRLSAGGQAVETLAGSVVGTPAYMSPEQADGRLNELGPATDVYSLGATLYCVLSGRPPVDESNLIDVLQKVRKGDVPPADHVRPQVPKALAAVCAKAMSVSPGERYPSALPLAQDVERWLADEPVTVYRDSLATRAGRWVRKHKTMVTTAAATLLVTLVGLSAGLFVVGGLNQRLEAANGELTRSNTDLVAAKEEAEQKRQEAENGRSIVVAVNEFLLRDLLGQADIGTQPYLGEEVERNPNITVTELLDRAAKAIEGKFQDQPAVEAAVRETVGGAYRALGKYELAQPHMERSVALAEEKLGAGHPDTLVRKHNLAVLHRARGKYVKAEVLYLEVIGQQEKKLGADHPHTLVSKHNLAVLYRDRGQHDKAEPLLLEVLRQSVKTMGPDHPDTLKSKHSLAALYRARGQYDKAEPLFLEVIELRERKLGADHPDTLNSKHSLALLYGDRGQHAKAEVLYLEVIGQQEKKLGADHPHTLLSRYNLGRVYRARGQHGKAEPLLLEVIGQQEKKLGGDHPHTLASKDSLAALYQARGQYGKAEPLLLEVLQQYVKSLGDDHPDTLTSKHILAGLYGVSRQHAKAELLYLEVIGQQEKKLGADHHDTLASKHNLAVLYRDRGQHDKAEPLLLEVLRQSVQSRGANHPDTLATKNSLAGLHRARGQYDKAELLLLEVLHQNAKLLGDDHLTTLNSKHNLAALYGDRGQHEKAEPLLLEVIGQRERKLGADHPDTLNSKHGLALLYRARGQNAKAEPLLLEVLRQTEKTLGADHPDTLNRKNSLAALYWSMKKLNRSIPLFEEVLQQQAKILGSAHPSTLRSLANLGVNYGDAGRLEEGIRRLEEAVAKARTLPGGSPADLAWIFPALAWAYDRNKQFEKSEALHGSFVVEARKRFGPDDPRTADSLAQLGTNLLRQRKFPEAEKILRDGLRIREKVQPDLVATFNTKSMLGEALLGRKKYAEAEPLLLQGYEGMNQRKATIPAAGQVRLTEALERLVQLYDGWGKHDKRDEWRKKLEQAKAGR